MISAIGVSIITVLMLAASSLSSNQKLVQAAEETNIVTDTPNPPDSNSNSNSNPETNKESPQPATTPQLQTEEQQTQKEKPESKQASSDQLPKCDGSFQDCVTRNGDTCKAGEGGEKCECLPDNSDCPKNPNVINNPVVPALKASTTEGGGPDHDCLFHPELPKCKSDNGKCPDGFNQNEDGNCFPKHDRCPKGFHGHEDDETGRCISDRVPCQPGYLRDPGFPTCSSKSFVCKEHPEISGCKEGEKPQVCPIGFRLEANGHTCFKIVNHRTIHVPSHSSSSGSSSSSNTNSGNHNLSAKCFDQIRIAWLAKIQRGDNKAVDNIIDPCLNIP